MMNMLQLLSASIISQPLVLGVLLMLLLAVITDLSAHKIPNKLVLFGLVFSFIFQSVIFQSMAIEGDGWLNWLTGVAVAFACFIPLYLLRAMAAGDVKLMMAVGGFLGYPLIITAVTYSFLAGGVIAICYVLIKGRGKLLIQNLYAMLLSRFIKTTTSVSIHDGQAFQQSAGNMPYATAIAVGTIITLYLQLTGKTF
jgi:prepilin peptidase CpaA